MGTIARISAICAFLAIAAGLSVARAEEPVDWRFSLWLPPTHPNTLQAKEWAESIEEASNGKLRIHLYAAQQLGRAMEHYDMARRGSVEIAHVSFGYEAERLPIANVTLLPFLMSNARGGSRAIDQGYRAYAPREMPELKFCLAFAHDPGTLHARKKVLLPEQLRGLKVRASNTTMARFITMPGGKAIFVPAPGTREAIEREDIDAILFPYGSLFVFGIDRVVHYHLDLPLYASTFGWVINRAKYESLNAALRKVVDAHCNTQWAGRIGDGWAKIEASGRERVRMTSGHTVYEVDDAEHTAWRRAAEPLRQQWAARMQELGLHPARILGELQASLERYDAAYQSGRETDPDDTEATRPKRQKSSDRR